MHYISTRNNNIRASLSQAILRGLADDGGLFVPEFLPKIDWQSFPDNLSYPDFAKRVLQEYFSGDLLEKYLEEICHAAFNFPINVNPLNNNTSLLELYHGPTLSFKDFGARFLAECINRLTTDKKITIMVATSGDTGSAVASAFHQKSNTLVIILYPSGKVSKRQEKQLTCWDGNIISFSVDGTFDDCQRLVKSAFAEEWWKNNLILSSANSINIGRLLPQIVYYAYASTQFYREHKFPCGFIVPTGNLGNATAGYYAKEMGFPIREIVLSTNANAVIEDYLKTGQFQPRQSIKTLANAMDVGSPSNFERLKYLFNSFDNFKKNVSAFDVSDEQIVTTIKTIYEKYNKIICPHTATACFVREKLSHQPWIVVATADPSKFEDIIEPVIKTKIDEPSQLVDLLSKPSHAIKIDNNLEAIKEVVINNLQMEKNNK